MRAAEHKGAREETEKEKQEEEDGRRGTDYREETWDPLSEMRRGR